MPIQGDTSHASRVAVAFLTAGLDRRDGMHERLYEELVATHDGAALLAIGLANVAELLCVRLAEHTGCGEDEVLQALALELCWVAQEEQYDSDEG